MRERQRPEYADHWSDEKILESRARFNFDLGLLIIERVRTSDEGFYKCRVDFKQSPTKYFEIQLVVVSKWTVEIIFIRYALVQLRVGTTTYLHYNYNCT